MKRTAAGAKRPLVVLPTTQPKVHGKKALRRVGESLRMKEEIEEVRQRHQMEAGLQRKTADKLAQVFDKQPWE